MKPSQDFFEPHQRLIIKKEFDIKSIQKIIVVGVDQLGGLMMSSPFFRELRAAFPNAYIVNLVAPLTFGAMQNCPYIDEVWKFDKKQSFKIAKKIKDDQFDLALLVAGSLRAALIAYLGRVPNRVGFDNDGRGRLLTVQLHQEFSSRYRPENIFDVLRAIGINPQGVYEREVWLSSKDINYAQIWADENLKKGEKVLAFNPFSTDPKRRWTDSGWQSMLIGIKKMGLKAVMLVAPNEVAEAESMLQQWQVDDVHVETHSVPHTAAILNHVSYVIGPESGFIHMALAVNKPHVIALFNVLPPKSTFPVSDDRHCALIEDTLPCCPCYLYKFKDRCPNDLVCMSQLGADKVLNAIKKFEENDIQKVDS
ncbi:glycosyltransferase family 9 protein [Thiomicrorhabdus arctica]|uniref:glycosyltransferase family 9 protein n=1 Tax=Thiomicrorhabdus arctica TaxID=131540 RepID=UPI00039AA55B|nr:glycosyltransferase family 9 protein [Thiomicrorhabdus arctica]